MYPRINRDLPSSPNDNPVAALASAPTSDNGGEMVKVKAGDAKGEPVEVHTNTQELKALCEKDRCYQCFHMGELFARVLLLRIWLFRSCINVLL